MGKTPNRITNVAIVGATGNSGSHMTKALLSYPAGRFIITALSRSSCDSPESPEEKRVPHYQTRKIDYSDHDSLVSALRGQDALVITLAGRAPTPDTELALVRAAGEARVPWILPNEWGPDTDHEGLLRDVPAFGSKLTVRNAIAQLGQSSFIALSTGFWYEWSLAMPAAFGFDLIGRNVTFFDEGETRIAMSTWPQVGRAVAALLNLPIKSEDGGACLEAYKNELVYTKSFTINQREIFGSVLGVTGTTEGDWVVTKEPSTVRYETGAREIAEGNFAGYPKMVARVFYPDGTGDPEARKGTLNTVLGLPREDLDGATEMAVERAKLLSHP